MRDEGGELLRATDRTVFNIDLPPAAPGNCRQPSGSRSFEMEVIDRPPRNVWISLDPSRPLAHPIGWSGAASPSWRLERIRFKTFDLEHRRVDFELATTDGPRPGTTAVWNFGVDLVAAKPWEITFAKTSSVRDAGWATAIVVTKHRALSFFLPEIGILFAHVPPAEGMSFGGPGQPRLYLERETCNRELAGELTVVSLDLEAGFARYEAHLSWKNCKGRRRRLHARFATGIMFRED